MAAKSGEAQAKLRFSGSASMEEARAYAVAGNRSSGRVERATASARLARPSCL